MKREFWMSTLFFFMPFVAAKNRSDTSLFLFISFGKTSGQSSVQSEPDTDFMPSDLSYFVDDHNQLSFEEVTKKEFNSIFSSNSSYHNSDFKANSSYWIKLTLNFPVIRTILAPGIL